MKHLNKPAALLVTAATAIALVVSGCGSSNAPTSHPDADILDTAKEGSSQATGGASTAAADGKAIFASAGCSGCHTFAAAGATATIGPDLAEISEEGAAPIREAIVDPDAEILEGYKKGVMPTDYSTKLSKTELAAVVAFIADAGAKTKAGE